MKTYAHVPTNTLARRMLEGLCWNCGDPLPVQARRTCDDCKSRRRTGSRTTPTRRQRRSAIEKRRRERVARAPGRATREQLAARWAYYGGKCWMCGNPAMLFDHVKPLLRGGSNWPSNQRPACWPCNTRKAANWPWLLSVPEVSDAA